MKYAEECKPVTRQVCEKVHYAPVCRDVITQECSQVPKEECRQVPEEVCTDVNERKCETVEKEECVKMVLDLVTHAINRDGSSGGCCR